MNAKQLLNRYEQDDDPALGWMVQGGAVSIAVLREFWERSDLAAKDVDDDGTELFVVEPEAASDLLCEILYGCGMTPAQDEPDEESEDEDYDPEADSEMTDDYEEEEEEESQEEKEDGEVSDSES